MRHKFYIYALVVIAIIFAGVSPACHFVSGKSVIQICAADGSVQQIEVDAALDPFFAAEKKMPEPRPDITDTCPFCFAAAYQDYAVLRSVDFTFDALPRYLAVGAGTVVPVGHHVKPYDSRGPPHVIARPFFS